MSFRQFLTTPLAENMVSLLAKQNSWSLDLCFSSQSDGRSVNLHTLLSIGMILGAAYIRVYFHSFIFAEAQHAVDVTFYA